MLQLGLGFCPLDSLHVTETIKDLYLFARNLTFNFIFDKDRQKAHLERELTEWTKHFTMEEFRTLRDLMLLYEEGATKSDPGSTLVDSLGTAPFDLVPDSRPQLQPTTSKIFKPKSRNFPDLMTCPAIWAFLHQSIKDIKHIKIFIYFPGDPSSLGLDL